MRIHILVTKIESCVLSENLRALDLKQFISYMNSVFNLFIYLITLTDALRKIYSVYHKARSIWDFRLILREEKNVVGQSPLPI